MRAIQFLENLLSLTNKTDDIEFLVSLLFELKNDIERGIGNES